MQLDSIYNNRSIAPPVLVDPFESGYELFLSRGLREWVHDETGLLATVVVSVAVLYMFISYLR